MKVLSPLRSLPPVGEPIRLRRVRQKREEPLIYMASGTAALAYSLQTLVRRARESGSSALEVLIPAYGCPDIVSAIAFAGLRARLVDLDGRSPFPSPEAWCAAISTRTLALVTVGFLGLRDPFSPSEAVASGLSAGSFVEDCCQVHPSAARAADDRSIVLSFGRGKPVSVMHGGAAILAPALASWRPALAAPKGVLAQFARLEVATRLYNLVRSPWLYGWVTQLPGLGVGQTEFAPLEGLVPMNERVRERLDLARGWGDPRRERLQRLLRERFLGLGSDVLAADLWRAFGRDGDWLLRYPLLLRNREVRDVALARLNEAGLGASAMYAAPLQQIPGVRAFAELTDTPGAAAFADRVLTLPLHADVEERDVGSMCDILSRVGRV